MKNKIEKFTSNNFDLFFYGNRLKATIYYYEKEKTFEAKLYTYGDKVFKSNLFFNDTKSKLENYQNANNYVMEYLNNCKY